MTAEPVATSRCSFILLLLPVNGKLTFGLFSQNGLLSPIVLRNYYSKCKVKMSAHSSLLNDSGERSAVFITFVLVACIPHT